MRVFVLNISVAYDGVVGSVLEKLVVVGNVDKLIAILASYSSSSSKSFCLCFNCSSMYLNLGGRFKTLEESSPGLLVETTSMEEYSRVLKTCELERITYY